MSPFLWGRLPSELDVDPGISLQVVLSERPGLALQEFSICSGEG
jgi:hypothetical protein